MIRLWVMGTTRIESDTDGSADDLLAQPKAVALLVYLTLARPRGFHWRDKLVTLLWPEIDQEHGRPALRKLLHRLRQSVGDTAIESPGNVPVSISKDAVWCDALVFDQAVDDDRLAHALDLYGGELLPGFFAEGAEEFDRWLDEEREYYRRRVFHAAWELVQRYVGDNQLTNAAHLARKVARLAPTDERMLRRIMTMLSQLGDRAGSLDVYARFSKQLWREYESRPSAETERLVEAIKRGDPLPSI